jgi:hypothetical protein
VSLRRNLRLYRKAIERGWDIPEAQKQEALTLAGSAMRDPDCSMKERLEGAKLVMAANGQNIKVDDQLFRMMTALLKPTPGGLTINGPVQINMREAVDQLREALPDAGEQVKMLERLEKESSGNGKH